MPAAQALVLALGAVLIVTGAAAISWAGGVLAFGVLLMLAVVDLRR